MFFFILLFLLHKYFSIAYKINPPRHLTHVLLVLIEPILYFALINSEIERMNREYIKPGVFKYLFSIINLELSKRKKKYVYNFYNVFCCEYIYFLFSYSYS